MSLTVSIPSPLRRYTEGQGAIEVSGHSVGAALESLLTLHPSLKAQLFTDDGRLRSFVNVYLNDEDIRYLQKTETAVNPGDTIAIVPSIAGGSGDRVIGASGDLKLHRRHTDRKTSLSELKELTKSNQLEAKG